MVSAAATHVLLQDFQFGCGQYPAHPAFIASVKAEAEANVLRIRHHASLAIFAGNSEDYQVRRYLARRYTPDSFSLRNSLPGRCTLSTIRRITMARCSSRSALS